MSNELGEQVARGALWLVMLRLSTKGIGIISTFILARLLSPSDFGLVAIAMSIFVLLDLISRFGFDTALIQKKNITTEYYDTAWTLNFLLGLLACLLLVAFSYPISSFYDNDSLQMVLLSVSALFVINGSLNIGVVDFRREMTFSKEFRLYFLPKLLSSVFTIAVAFYLRSFWALVFGSLVWKGAEVANSYLMHSYRPKFSLKVWRELFGFTKWLVLNNLFIFLNTRSPELIVGKILTPQSAGFLTIAQEVSMLPTAELASNVNRAAYPGYSKLAHDHHKLFSLYVDVMSSIALFVYPAGFGLLAVSDLLVPVLLGNQWLEIIILIKYLSIGCMLSALNSNAGYVFLALGSPKIVSCFSLARAFVFIPLLIILTNLHGLVGAGQAAFVISFIMFFVYSLLVYLKFEVSFLRIVSIHCRPLFASLFMGLSVYTTQHFLLNQVNIPDWLSLIVLVLLGVVIYILTIVLIWAIVGRPNGPEEKVLSKFGVMLRP